MAISSSSSFAALRSVEVKEFSRRSKCWENCTFFFFASLHLPAPEEFPGMWSASVFLKGWLFSEDTSERAHKYKSRRLHKTGRRTFQLPYPTTSTNLSLTGGTRSFTSQGNYFSVSPAFWWSSLVGAKRHREHEPGSRGPLSSPPISTCRISFITILLIPNILIERSSTVKQMNGDCRFHFWKMKIFTRTCVSRTQDHVI